MQRETIKYIIDLNATNLRQPKTCPLQGASESQTSNMGFPSLILFRLLMQLLLKLLRLLKLDLLELLLLLLRREMLELHHELLLL